MRQIITGSLRVIGVSILIAPAVIAAESTIRINRTLPTTVRTEPVPRFSISPSDQELFGARIFEEPLIPIGATSKAENRLLAQELVRYVENAPVAGLTPIESFLR